MVQKADYDSQLTDVSAPLAAEKKIVRFDDSVHFIPADAGTTKKTVQFAEELVRYAPPLAYDDALSGLDGDEEEAAVAERRRRKKELFWTQKELDAIRQQLQGHATRIQTFDAQDIEVIDELYAHCASRFDKGKSCSENHLGKIFRNCTKKAARYHVHWSSLAKAKSGSDRRGLERYASVKQRTERDEQANESRECVVDLETEGASEQAMADAYVVYSRASLFYARIVGLADEAAARAAEADPDLAVVTEVQEADNMEARDDVDGTINPATIPEGPLCEKQMPFVAKKQNRRVHRRVAKNLYRWLVQPETTKQLKAQ